MDTANNTLEPRELVRNIVKDITFDIVNEICKEINDEIQLRKMDGISDEVIGSNSSTNQELNVINAIYLVEGDGSFPKVKEEMQDLEEEQDSHVEGEEEPSFKSEFPPPSFSHSWGEAMSGIKEEIKDTSKDALYIKEEEVTADEEHDTLASHSESVPLDEDGPNIELNPSEGNVTQPMQDLSAAAILGDYMKQQMNKLNVTAQLSSPSLRPQKGPPKDKKTFECDDCGRIFYKNSALITHLRTHTGEKPFQCKQCGAKFSKTSTLNSHLRIHTGEKPSECKLCGKKFSVSSNFVRHLRTHTGEKPYQCKNCEKKFSQNQHLVSHMRTHTKEKPFQCSVCGKKFSQNHHLLYHLSTHTREREPNWIA